MSEITQAVRAVCTEVPLRAIVVGDIHLYNPRTPTARTISSLDREIVNAKVFSSIELLVINGDLLDRLITPDRPESNMFLSWATRLIALASKHNVCLRVLYGTPSHDNHQSKVIAYLAQEMNDRYPCDVKYIAELSIERIERFQIDVLWVPDRWRNHVSQTLEETHDLLKSRGIEQVDYAFMHGSFAYQLPSAAPDHVKHNEQSYLKLVKREIYISHVHKASQHERIYAPGSFDRDRQGETEPKGFIHFERSQGFSIITFMVNHDAKVYDRLDVSALSVEDGLKKLHRKVLDLPEGSQLEIICQKGSAMKELLETIRGKYVQHEFEMSFLEGEEAQKVKEKKAEYRPVVITKQTLPDLILMKMTQNGVDRDVKSLAMELLSEVL